MATYESYKDSGIKWLGQIPSHWGLKKCRAFFQEVTEQNLSRKSSNQLQFKYGTIVPKPDQSVDEDILETISKYTLVKPGDIVINGLNLNFDLISQRIGIVREEGVITSAYVSIRPKNIASAKFYEYLLKALDARKTFHGFGTGVRATLSWKELKHKLLPIVPFHEQEAIVEYLDKVTADIDRAIEAQQKMIDALNERKQIIITRAVTRGLNPEAPLRDSGIDWLGQIPEHWEIKKLKTLAEIKGRIGFRGYTNSDLVEQGEGAITLSPSNIINGKMSYDKCSYLSWYKYYESPEIMVNNGHILFVKTGSSYGKTAFVTDLPMEATINPQFSLIKPRKVNPNFLNFAISSQYFKLQVERGVIGSTIPTISQSTIGNMLVLVPSLDEQNTIIDYLNCHFENIDSIISNCERMISLLQERKQIIINEVITGKKKVV